MTPWTVAYQAPLSMKFYRQKYWSGLPFPSLGDLPAPGIKHGSRALKVDSLSCELPGKPICVCVCVFVCMYIYIHIYIHISVYVCIYKYIYIHICMYVCIYIHTYIDTQIDR